MGLDVGHDIRDVAVMLSVGGDVDSSAAEDFHKSLQHGLELAAGHPARTLVVDLGGVTYFGSAGLNAVLACYERGCSDAVTVRVVAHNPEVTRPIEVTKLDGVLRPFPTVADAITGG